MNILDKIKITSERTSENPNTDDFKGDHYRVRLTIQDDDGRRQMSLTYSKGYGHKGAPPEKEEVLSCLVSDSFGVSDSPSFEDWCDCYGYDTDSRKAEKIFKECKRQDTKFRRFCGDQFDAIAEAVENY